MFIYNHMSLFKIDLEASIDLNTTIIILTNTFTTDIIVSYNSNLAFIMDPWGGLEVLQHDYWR